jgi:hypothetical protein
MMPKRAMLSILMYIVFKTYRQQATGFRHCAGAAPFPGLNT